jgi:preprotein translocase subunit SecE
MSITQIVLLSILVLVAILAAANWRKLQAWGVALQVFYREVRVEMQKVAWPSRNDLIGSTVVVLVAVVVLTAIIAGADEVLSRVLSLLLGKGA